MLEAVVRPQSAKAALSSLGGRQCAVLAGGTLLLPEVSAGTSGLKTLVSLDRSGLSAVKVTNGRVVLGAMVRLAEIEDDERLATLHPVVRAMGGPVLRNSATVGGNLFAPTPYGDLTAALVALDATAIVESAAGTRSVKVEDFVAEKHRAGEIVTSVRFALPAPGTLRFHKAMRRAQNSAAIVTVAAYFELDGGRVKRVRVALGGVGPHALRSRSAEAVLKGQPLDATTVMQAGEAARRDIKPVDDAYASAWYRRQVLPVHLRRAILGE
jgi:aerobic carbon-monoxide dehydrogenase medium subunit